MLKFLGITKIHGADKSNILKNSWIALHMHDLTMRQWANAMFMKDTPSDEIALYVLCKMYHHHVAMVTSAKIWSTVECDTPMSDEELLSLCDLCLLYIEPGVFGKLKLKPAMPPAPPHLILESALDILPPDVSSNSDARGSTLNLMTCHTSPINVDTGKNDWNIDAIGDNLSKFPLRPVSTTYNDCKLSGALESILLDVDVQELITSMLSDQNTTEDADIDVGITNTADTPVPIDEGQLSSSMNECMVIISCLTDTKINTVDCE